MATKILITPKNSIWGVIVNPQSSNTYRHALSFDTPALKKAFIDKELCEGKDYKALLAAQKETSFTRTTATSGAFTISPDQYQDETFLSLLNKDFCIIEEDGIEQFYTLSAVRDPDGGNTIIFSAELDIFFTYGVKDMFNDKPTEITRAMSPRFELNSNQEIVPLTNYLNTPLINNEDFDNKSSGLLFPSGTPEILFKDYSPIMSGELIAGGSRPVTDQEKEDVNEFISENLSWQFLSVATKIEDVTVPLTDINLGKGRITTNVEGKNGNSIGLPFANLITASGRTGIQVINGTRYLLSITEQNSSGGLIDSMGQGFQRKLLEDTSVIDGTFTSLPVSVLAELENVKIVIRDTVNGYKDVSIQIAKGQNGSYYVGHDINTSLIEPQTSGMILFQNKISSSSIEYSSKLSPFPKFFNLDPLNTRSTKTEIKTYFSPYSEIRIGSSTKNKQDFSPQFFTKNELVFKANNAYLSENWGFLISLKNYYNIYNNNTDFLAERLDHNYEDFSSYSIPTDNDSWTDFLRENKTQQNASFLSKGLGVGAGILGILAAPFTAGASLAVTGLAGVSLATKSVSDINQQMAQRQDVKNTTNKQNNNGSTLTYDYAQKSTNPFIIRYEIEPFLKDLIATHFYKHGYSFGGLIQNINSLLDTRYWFNYIEVKETFENIKLQASAEIKQLINDTLATGLTIWHIRDLNTFKGIKNYENENVEMSLITTVNDEEVINDNREEE